MYMQGFPGEYHFLQGVGIMNPGTGQNPYPGLSTNQAWVNNFQNPFNKGVLAQSAALGATDPAGAYAMLAPAFAKIQNDAINFVNSYPPSMQAMAQATIDGWKKDFPLIQGFLNKWAAAAPSAVVAAPAGSAQPTTILQDQAPAVYASTAPAIFGPSAPAAAAAYTPAPANVNVTTAPAGDLTSTIAEFAPWVAGAAIVGLLLSSGRRSARNGR